MIFLISDTHFSHTNIIKYCNRPFKDVEEMNEIIINKWNSVVKENDIVYHLGDFALYNAELKKLVNRLNGKIYLIRGNHDRKTVTFYNNAGLEVLPTQTKLDKYKLILSHRPLMNNQIPNGYINVHGHIHNSELDQEKFNINNHICVSVEMIDYKPIKIKEIKAP